MKQNEEKNFTNETPRMHFDRRSFLKLSGFGLTGAILSSCSGGKVDKAIPLLIKPEEITPGVSNWYASTCHGCTANCGVTVKSRDGRPIKIEGNKLHPVSKGGVCAVGHAQILSLYDSHRLKGALNNGDLTSWENLDTTIKNKLEDIKDKKIYFLSGTIASPTTRNTINNFLKQFPNSKLVEYDAMSVSAILDAHKENFGARVLPRYKFEKAEVVVSIDADFLGSWISPIEFTAGYTSLRSLENNPNQFSYHVQFESRLSLTGSNADKRISVAPQEYEEILTSILENIQTNKKQKNKFINSLAEKLKEHKGKSLVVCGVNDLRLQLLTNSINYILGNYGATIDIASPSKQLNGSDEDLEILKNDVANKNVGAIFIANSNPVYDFENGNEFGKQLKNIPLVVSFASYNDETAEFSNYVCPTPHGLESWNDSQIVDGVFTITQPLINPQDDTRTIIESLNSWTNKKETSYDSIKNYWKSEIYSKTSTAPTFEKFWNKTIHDGFAEIKNNNSVRNFNFTNSNPPQKKSIKNINGEFALVLYEKISIRNGQNALNPWLQELQDPITKISWDNYASISRKTAETLDINEEDVLLIENGNLQIELPAHIQIGQNENTIAIAVGYGRKGTNRFTDIGPEWFQSVKTVEKNEFVGKNIFPFLKTEFVKISKTGKTRTLANSQEYNSLQLPKELGYKKEERAIFQKTSFDEYKKDQSSGSIHHGELLSLWTETPRGSDIHWGLSIDLTKCIGCSACIVSCQAENNIPVVGKDEMHRDRDLHWIRIDRYYNEYENELDVLFQPMLCQHCGNAPCETVCPVLATVHSEEGLNQQAYNRCVGTRYCANNCPYKVRRFNWFEYEHNDDREKLVLNPDVTVRERGVIEKCSMCIQRIQEIKILAKKEGRKISDGEIEPACAQSCPSQAFVFGNLKDEKSKISKLSKEKRAYHVLEEIGVKPSLTYLTRVKNREKETTQHG